VYTVFPHWAGKCVYALIMFIMWYDYGEKYPAYKDYQNWTAYCAEQLGPDHPEKVKSFTDMQYMYYFSSQILFHSDGRRGVLIFNFGRKTNPSKRINLVLTVLGKKVPLSDSKENKTFDCITANICPTWFISSLKLLELLEFFGGEGSKKRHPKKKTICKILIYC
jgi:hypothetical protein